MKKRNSTFNALMVMLTVCLLAGFLGTVCNTTQQRAAYNTIYSVSATEQAAVVGYFTAVAKGITSTNEVPAVALKDAQFTAAAQAAADATQLGTNGLAPASLVIMATDIGNFIATLK